MKKRALVALLAAAVLLCACGLRGKSQDSVVRRRLDGEPKTLNPILATMDPEQIVLALLERNLLDYDEKLNLVPGLAEEVSDSPDHLTTTIRLRKDARWEDGTRVTAADVVFTLTTLLDPKTPALTRRALFDGFVRAEAVDAETARVVFKTPATGRRDAFNLPLLSAAAWAGGDVATHPRNRNPLANGPYRLGSWEAGRTLTLVRNTQYFGEKAGPEQVVFRVVPETAPAFAALGTGDIDEMRLTAAQKKELDARAGASGAANVPSVITFDQLSYSYIGWNNRLPIFSDRRVRRALTMLVDRESIDRNLFGGLAKIANGPLPPAHWAWDSSISPWPYDPKAAEALLDEAGFRKGADGIRHKGSVRLAFTLSLGMGSDVQRQIVELAQQSFRKSGIDMAIQPLEWAAFAAKLDAGEFDAWAAALNLDPNPDLAVSWHSAQVPPVGLNSAFYRNPEVDALLDRLKATFDRDETLTLLARAQALIHEDEPVTFLNVPLTKWGVSARLTNVRTSPIGLFMFWPGAAAWRTSVTRGPIS
ncbi:MAG: ABC transporter substrate-binding protein [Thermoanaerobaculia bacterium]|nr:ABC transporter substrate-binding protein [Thermoanaerobaculia bacterium]